MWYLSLYLRDIVGGDVSSDIVKSIFVYTFVVVVWWWLYIELTIFAARLFHIIPLVILAVFLG